MSFMQQLLGGGQQQQEYQDFIDRYDQGAPYEGISDQEALDRYQQVAPYLPPGAYQQAAQEAFARMSPQERMEFGQYVQQRAQQQGVGFSSLPRGGGNFQDPGFLAQMMGGMTQQQPDLLGQLLGGGGGGGMLGNPLAKAALAGVAAMAVKQMMGRR
jgi:hypothetical protein